MDGYKVSMHRDYMYILDSTVRCTMAGDSLFCWFTKCDPHTYMYIALSDRRWLSDNARQPQLAKNENLSGLFGMDRRQTSVSVRNSKKSKSKNRFPTPRPSQSLNNSVEQFSLSMSRKFIYTWVTRLVLGMPYSFIPNRLLAWLY